jgi:hypothetical protein
MEEVISCLHKLLDVPSDDNFDLACFGLGSSHPSNCAYVISRNKCTSQDSIDDAPQLGDEDASVSPVESYHSESQLEEISDDDNPATYNIDN